MNYRSVRNSGIFLILCAVLAIATCQAGEQVLKRERVYHLYETSSWLKFDDEKGDWVLLLRQFRDSSGDSALN